ncbi:MAG: NADH-quinone oxidoreductase subunit L [Planctomycetes bacterium]|nr:NADH-quinone oxidoreductase subunit L [Planctomycetota bacterium]
MPTSTANTSLCREALIILALPLLAFVIQVFFGKRIPPKHREGDWIPTLAMFAGLCIALKMFFADLLGSPEGIERQLWYPLSGLDWLDIGKAGQTAGGLFHMDFGILVDNLTIAMLLVVTLVSFLVHLYSWGYMHGEARYNHFFAYLALFSFSMLGLCITSNLLFCFIFWELVGVCSYFLIGFYFEKKSASNAAIKAFLTTRVGDLGFLLAILIIAATVRSLEYDDIFKSVQENKWGFGLAAVPLTFVAISLFFGPMGKSAQFPLHVWLPDAMEGPTPVSALIHAATMVAAGVYVVGRMFPFMAGPGYFQGDFFHSTPLLVVAVTGSFTAIFAASIAFSQTDIKKVLAYSTVSQLGYMMLGLGVGSVAAALFHLTTHAMFKALLFLGSGSVIHAVHSNEMADMGGLWRKMKVTWSTFLIGTLAISGLPYLSGFFSKEAILTQAKAVADHHGGWYRVAFYLGMATAFMTPFYMFRMFWKTFHGRPRNHHAYEHAHESPWTMTVPLVILAVLSIGMGGLKGEWFEERVNSLKVTENLFSDPQRQVFIASEALNAIKEAHGHAHHEVLLLSLAAFLLGLFGSWVFFGPRSPLASRDLLKPGTLAGAVLGPLNHCLKNLWFVDALYNLVFINLVHFLRVLCGAFDMYIIDGLVNLQGHLCKFLAWVVGIADYEGVDGTVRGLGGVTLWAGRLMPRLQTGNLQEYVYASVFFATGVLLVSVALIRLLL